MLWQAGATPLVTLQGFAEFWNVCTRPSTARGALGLSAAETHRRFRIMKRHVEFLPDTDDVRVQWEQLVITHQVEGVQVHDTRLVASMLAHSVTHLLTLNTSHFQRYQGIIVAHPQDVIDGKV